MLHKTTLDGLTRALIPGHHPAAIMELSLYDIQDRVMLTNILTCAAHFELMPKPVIASWVNAILYKLYVVGITNTVELHWALPELNNMPEVHG